jgi:GAF domain-containing protein
MSDSRLKPGQATEYLSFLSKAAQAIGSSLDYRATLKSVADTMVPNFSDWCAVDIVQEDGILKRVAIAHVDTKQIKLALELSRKFPRDPKAPSGTPHVLNTGESEMQNGITDEMLVAAAINDEHLQMMRDLQFYSLMIVPIKSRRKVLGTITFVWAESKNLYTLADLAFAETLGAIAGSAIDNARLYRAARSRSAA